MVTDPAQADLAIIRAPAPYESEHPNFFFGSRQHEGRLTFTKNDAAYVELLRVSPMVPTVFLTTLERPLILTNVSPHATALLGDFGKVTHCFVMDGWSGSGHPLTPVSQSEGLFSS